MADLPVTRPAKALVSDMVLLTARPRHRGGAALLGGTPRPHRQGSINLGAGRVLDHGPTLTSHAGPDRSASTFSGEEEDS